MVNGLVVEMEVQKVDLWVYFEEYAWVDSMVLIMEHVMVAQKDFSVVDLMANGVVVSKVALMDPLQEFQPAARQAVQMVVSKVVLMVDERVDERVDVKVVLKDAWKDALTVVDLV